MSKSLPADKNILIVEDDESCRVLLETILEKIGVPFEVSGNGQEAVNKVRRGHFDAVLMDLRMPILDGYEAARAIRETHKDLPIIALTAHSMDWVKGKCRHCGMNDFLSKPFDQEQLLKKLHKWVRIPNKAL